MSHAIYGKTNLEPQKKEALAKKRYASVLELDPQKEAYYRKLHADVWPSVLKQIEQCHICNYSIHLAPIGEKLYLFSYFEYIGTDFSADMKKAELDPETQRWWAECKPCQKPLENRQEGEWWMNLEEVFYYDSSSS